MNLHTQVCEESSMKLRALMMDLLLKRELTEIQLVELGIEE